MRYTIFLAAPAALCTLWALLVSAQNQVGTQYPGVNLLASSHPLAITARDTNAVLVVPISKSAAAASLPSGVKLLPNHSVPGLRDDQWPMIINVGVDKDLSEYSVSRVDFHHGYAGIGWVDKLGDGKTATARSFDALFSQNYFIVASSNLLAGFTSLRLNFTPGPAPGPFEASGSTQYRAAKDGNEYFSLTYQNATSADDRLPRSTYLDVLLQGRWQNGLCIFHEQFFNYPDTDPFDIVADITLSDRWLPKGLAGRYQGVKGLRLNQHWIETIQQPCSTVSTSHGKL